MSCRATGLGGLLAALALLTACGLEGEPIRPTPQSGQQAQPVGNAPTVVIGGSGYIGGSMSR